MSLQFSIAYDSFAPVMDYPEDLYVFDLSGEYRPDLIKSKTWGIGKYNEKRPNMYTAPQYKRERDIHMGIDLWASAGSPVYSFYEGFVVYLADHNEQGNYGPTIVMKYTLEPVVFYALYGHLSRSSLEGIEIGMKIPKGQKIAELGTEEENGGWPPHLHFQLSLDDPGEADMPGVVSKENLEEALNRYPDPRVVLGNLY